MTTQRWCASRVCAAVVVCAAGSAWGQLAVVSQSPVINANNVPVSSPVVVTFDRAVDRATVTGANFHLFGKINGPMGGSFAFSDGDRTVTLTPARRLAAGEVAILTLSHNLRGADGVALRSQGRSTMFTAKTAVSTGTFAPLDEFSNRDQTGAQTRIYGTNVCDLNGDGWADLCTVNEVSSDLRIFLNRADGSGRCGAMLPSYVPVPSESSPNDIADFDGDGFIDILTSSAGEGKIAIAFGRGDGTFRSVLNITVGSYPRGFGVFDADGDGDFDITVACAGANNIVFVRNNGNGTFAAPVAFEGGVGAEYGMHGVDMDNDGIFDLVVAGTTSQTVSVLRGNGNGTFTAVSSRSSGGHCWVVTCGDVNGDRFMDVSIANADSANGAILLGNGNGTLRAATIYPVGGHCVASDLADLDGDGDLDWALASFGAGRWYIYKNNGAGAFTPDVEILAHNNPSCTSPADLDNDGDIDLVLSDEIADVVKLMRNVGGGVSCPADFNGDGFLDFFDADAFIAAFENGDPAADFNGDGFLDFFDADAFVEAFEDGC